jgi:hypothetical protein
MERAASEQLGAAESEFDRGERQRMSRPGVMECGATIAPRPSDPLVNARIR